MRIVFVTPHPPSRAHARSLGFIVELARRHMVTAIALCQTAGDVATLRQLRTLGVETIAIPNAPAPADGAADEPLARAHTVLARVVARGDVGMIHIEGARLGTVARSLRPPVIWDVIGEVAAARRQTQAAVSDERDRASRPATGATGATQPVRVVGPAAMRAVPKAADDGAAALLGQYASVLVGAERDAISLLGARRALSAPLSARLTDLSALLTSTAPLPQEDDVALRSFPLLRRKTSRRDGKQRPLTAPTTAPSFPAQSSPTPRVGVRVIPEAIDLAYYSVAPEQRGRVGVLVYGDLADEATAQGIAWLLREVAPRIWRINLQINLTIVGRGGSTLPPRAFADVQAQLHDERVRLVEGLEDIRTVARQAALVIVPMLDVPGVTMAQHTHECALEAMALGTPTLVTQAALNGLMAVPGRDLLVATSADRLATLALRVLGDDELSGMLARYGRAYVARRHSWRLANQQLDQVYAAVLGRSPTGEADTEDVAADDYGTLEQVATSVGARMTTEESALSNAVSVMSMLGLVGLATHPLAGAPSSGRLAPRWR